MPIRRVAVAPVVPRVTILSPGAVGIVAVADVLIVPILAAVIPIIGNANILPGAVLNWLWRVVGLTTVVHVVVVIAVAIPVILNASVDPGAV
jgi:hypothetical protein